MTQSIARGEKRLGYSLVAPIFVLVFLVIGIPFLYTLVLSLTNKTVGMAPKFIGLRNYKSIFADSTYWLVLTNTLIYTVGSVAAKLAIGLGLALILNERFPGRSIARVLLLVPWALPGMVSAMTWKWMYNDTYGIINSLLKGAHLIREPIVFLSDPKMVLATVMIVNIWRGVPFFLFSILGGLQTIDGQMYEAAMIDGASALRRLVRITLPSVAGVVAITTLLSTIWTFNDFENVYLITGGGPLNMSSVISTYTYEVAFLQNDMARALAVAVSIIPLLVVLIAAAGKSIGGERE
jgi:multiple sugar transport system permease protein